MSTSLQSNIPKVLSETTRWSLNITSTQTIVLTTNTLILGLVHCVTIPNINQHKCTRRGCSDNLGTSVLDIKFIEI